MKPFDNANIVYCDNHLLVVDKPPGIATQPDLEDVAKAWVKKKYHKPGKVFLEPIHRLDKSVGGLVLFARTSKALSRLQALMRERKISKTYHALVEGILPKKEATLTHFLVHGDYKAFVDSQGKEAILHYHVLEEKNNTTRVSIDLATYDRALEFVSNLENLVSSCDVDVTNVDADKFTYQALLTVISRLPGKLKTDDTFERLWCDGTSATV